MVLLVLEYDTDIPVGALVSRMAHEMVMEETSTELTLADMMPVRRRFVIYNYSCLSHPALYSDYTYCQL